MAEVVMLLSNDFVSDPRVEREALALIRAGHAVTVLAWDRKGGSPETETRNGIRIERFGPRAHHGGGLGNLAAYREFWDLTGHRARALRPDVVHAHDMDTVPAALTAIKDRPATRLVLDFHELYRESKAVSSGAGAVIARPMVDRIEAKGLAHADLVILAWPGMEQRYRKRFHKDLVIVQNSQDINEFTPVVREPRDTFTYAYLGQKRYPEPLKRLVDCVGRNPGLSAVLAGGGVAEKEIADYASGVEGVHVSGRFLTDELVHLYRDADAVYSVYDDHVGNVKVHMPVKVLEALALGIPSVVRAGTWVADFVTEHGVGIAVDDTDRKAFDRALLSLSTDPERCREMGRRGRALAEAELNWAASERVLLDAYARVLSGPSRIRA